MCHVLGSTLIYQYFGIGLLYTRVFSNVIIIYTKYYCYRYKMLLKIPDF